MNADIVESALIAGNLSIQKPRRFEQPPSARKRSPGICCCRVGAYCRSQRASIGVSAVPLPGSPLKESESEMAEREAVEADLREGQTPATWGCNWSGNNSARR
jgi:hypothetical protein